MCRNLSCSVVAYSCLWEGIMASAVCVDYRYIHQHALKLLQAWQQQGSGQAF
jgi:hypothetical protein